MKKVLVTGGCGFIGSAVVNVLLEREHEVHILDNLSLGKNHWVGRSRGPQVHVQDLLDFDAGTRLFERIGPAVVIHLAAHHYIPFCEREPYEAYRLNVVGTLNVLELCRRSAIEKFFFASTGDVYAPTTTPHRETDAVSPIYVYGHTKYMAEQLCGEYFRTQIKAASAIIGRLFNAAGPRETNPHLIPEVVKQILERKPVIEVGNLWPKRDFVDVDSMARVIVDLTLKASGTQTVNIGSGMVQEIGEVLEILKSKAPNPVQIVSVASRQRANDRAYLCPDTARLISLNGAPALPFGPETAARIFGESAVVRGA